MKEKFKNDFKKVVEAKLFRTIVCGLGILVVALVIFQAGVFVGFHRASFGHAWGENYERNFGMIHRDSHMPFGGASASLPNAHGAFGTIIKVTLPTIIVSDSKDKTEKVVVIHPDTHIRNAQNDATTADLKVDSQVVVIGTPNTQGQIEAKFIRILPAGLTQ